MDVQTVKSEKKTIRLSNIEVRPIINTITAIQTDGYSAQQVRLLTLAVQNAICGSNKKSWNRIVKHLQRYTMRCPLRKRIKRRLKSWNDATSAFGQSNHGNQGAGIPSRKAGRFCQKYLMSLRRLYFLKVQIKTTRHYGF